MGKPAARVGDMHTCPMVTPGTPPVPHVGGPILPPGMPTVLIGGMPAATLSNMCTCVGPPDTIILGSTGVLIGGKPAARMGDSTAHGGVIVAGCPTVLIGEVAPGAPPIVVPPVVIVDSALPMKAKKKDSKKKDTKKKDAISENNSGLNKDYTSNEGTLSEEDDDGYLIDADFSM